MKPRLIIVLVFCALAAITIVAVRSRIKPRPQAAPIDLNYRSDIANQSGDGQTRPSVTVGRQESTQQQQEPPQEEAG